MAGLPLRSYMSVSSRALHTLGHKINLTMQEVQSAMYYMPSKISFRALAGSFADLQVLLVP